MYVRSDVMSDGGPAAWTEAAIAPAIIKPRITEPYKRNFYNGTHMIYLDQNIQSLAEK